MTTCERYFGCVCLHTTTCERYFVCVCVPAHNYLWALFRVCVCLHTTTCERYFVCVCLHTTTCERYFVCVCLHTTTCEHFFVLWALFRVYVRARACTRLPVSVISCVCLHTTTCERYLVCVRVRPSVSYKLTYWCWCRVKHRITQQTKYLCKLTTLHNQAAFASK